MPCSARTRSRARSRALTRVHPPRHASAAPRSELRARSLGPSRGQVWRQLLQRLWVDALCRLRRVLGTALFSPSEIGARFCGVVRGLLREMVRARVRVRVRVRVRLRVWVRVTLTLIPNPNQCTLVHRGGSGLSREWMRRRAAGLQATLALRDLSPPLTQAPQPHPYS